MSQQYLYIWTNSANWNSAKKIQLPHQQIKQMGIGQKHIVLRTQNRILGMGSNSVGQLGVDDYDDVEYENNLKQFIPISTKYIKGNISQISCGWNHTLILDDKGTVYSCGDGKNGALGHGRGTDSYSFKPVSINSQNLIQISAGRDHSLAISATKVYGWGNSKDGQLGLVKQKIYYEPQQLYVFASTMCYAGPKYSVFKTNRGIFVTGYNEGGQLGLGHQNKTKIPKKINQIQDEVVWLGGSTNYMIIKTEFNQYYFSGTGSFGQFLFPTKIKYFKKCKQISIGEQFGIVKDQNDCIYSWSNNNDQPVQNYQLTNLALSDMIVGPKMAACIAQGQDIIKYANTKNTQNYKFQQNPKISLRNDIKMAKSSIQWSNSQQNTHHLFGQSNPYSIINESVFRENQKKGRKQSQAIQARHDASYNNSQLSHLDKNFQHEDGRRDDNYLGRNSIRQQIKSPHFKKQEQNLFQRNIQVENEQQTNRISGFQTYDLEQKANGFSENRDISRNSVNRSRQRSIETISEETGPLGLTNNITSKTISKDVSNQNKSNKIKMTQNLPYPDLPTQNQMNQRVRYLQNQNRKKDEYIRKLRKQFIQLMDVVESNISLQNIAQTKQKDYKLKKRQQLAASQANTPDPFTKNMGMLRQILGKTIDSFTYDSLYYSD